MKTSSKRAHHHILLMLIFTAAYVPITYAQTLTYYIAAEEVLWDYAPSYPINEITGDEFTDDQKVFVEGNESDRIGRIYRKSQFIEYTDASFSVVKERPPEWIHLGVMGPAILANVGDTIEIVFMNKTGKPASMHPMVSSITKTAKARYTMTEPPALTKRTMQYPLAEPIPISGQYLSVPGRRNGPMNPLSGFIILMSMKMGSWMKREAPTPVYLDQS